MLPRTEGCAWACERSIAMLPVPALATINRRTCRLLKGMPAQFWKIKIVRFLAAMRLVLRADIQITSFG